MVCLMVPRILIGQEDGCGKEKSLPIPLQQFFCAAIPIRQNYFKKEKGKQMGGKKKEVRKRVERRNKYQEVKEKEKRKWMDEWLYLQ